MYDIFFLGDNIELWENCKSKYPNAQKISKDIKIEDLQKKSFTSMFWLIWDDMHLSDFDLTSYKATKWDNSYTHVFKNGNFYDGVCLVNKKSNISNKEFKNRFFIDKKEIDIIASYPIEYNKYNLRSYEDYLSAVNSSKTNMFWAVWNDIQVKKDFKFDYQIPKYNQNIVHIFKNKNYYDGICLMPTTKIYSRKEIDFRFFIDKIEVDIDASDVKPFDIFYINSYEEYLKAADACSTNMFWAVWDDLEVLSTFKFDYQVPAYNQHLVHVFKNKNYYDGICLMPKKNVYSRKEIEFRFFTDKVEVDVISSIPKKFDIIFISYEEPNADSNFAALKSKYPEVKRVHGVNGIHNAHRKAAELSNTKMFWVVDGDAQVIDDFKFDHQVAVWDQNTVHVWRSRNPINDLEYGYGGVKLLPTKLTINMDMTKPDMTTSISPSFKSMPTTSNITGFNTDSFTTWRSAFRECVKLSSRSIQGQVDKESEERLSIWCTAGIDKPFGEYAIDGAILGREYGLANRNNINELRKINDFKWLEEQFCERYRKN